MKKKVTLVVLTVLYMLVQGYVFVYHLHPQIIPSQIYYATFSGMFGVLFSIVLLLLILVIWNYPERFKNFKSTDLKKPKQIFFANILLMVFTDLYFESIGFFFFQVFVIVVCLLFTTILFSYKTNLKTSFERFYSVFTLNTYSVLLYSFSVYVLVLILNLDYDKINLQNITSSILMEVPTFGSRFLISIFFSIFSPFLSFFFTKQKVEMPEILDAD